MVAFTIFLFWKEEEYWPPSIRKYLNTILWISIIFEFLTWMEIISTIILTTSGKSFLTEGQLRICTILLYDGIFTLFAWIATNWIVLLHVYYTRRNRLKDAYDIFLCLCIPIIPSKIPAIIYSIIYGIFLSIHRNNVTIFSWIPLIFINMIFMCNGLWDNQRNPKEELCLDIPIRIRRQDQKDSISRYQRNVISYRKQLEIDESHPEQEECPICCDHIACIQLVCGHIYCSSCIRELRRRHEATICPMCRQQFRIKGAIYSIPYRPPPTEQVPSIV